MYNGAVSLILNIGDGDFSLIYLITIDSDHQQKKITVKSLQGTAVHTDTSKQAHFSSHICLTNLKNLNNPQMEEKRKMEMKGTG